jgi:Protein of unknown function (DUF3006)
MTGHQTRRAGRATIDRIEGDVAVLVRDGREEHWPRADLPEGASEGDVVDLDARCVDREATERLRDEVREARARAMAGRKPPPGSFDL